MMANNHFTYFQLVLLTRPNGRHQGAGEKPFRDSRIDMIACEDFVNLIDALDSEELVAAIRHHG